MTVPIDLGAIAEDSGALLITEAELLANALDADLDTLSVTGLTLGAGSNGNLVNNGGGTWSYTPALNDDTEVSFNYTITDGTANVAGSATLDISPVNDAPTTSTVTLAAVAEDNVRVITSAQLLVNAADVDSVGLTAAGLSIVSGGGTISGGGDGDGIWEYTPALNDASSVSFEYVIGDGADTTVGNATLDISPVNDAPTTVPVTLASVAEDTVRVITQAQLLVGANDVDGPALTATGLSIAAGLGSLVNNGNGTWNYTPALNDATGVSFNFSVSDGSLEYRQYGHIGHHARQRCADHQSGDAGVRSSRTAVRD